MTVGYISKIWKFFKQIVNNGILSVSIDIYINQLYYVSVEVLPILCGKTVNFFLVAALINIFSSTPFF